jgi:single-stranded DNA-binding protein
MPSLNKVTLMGHLGKAPDIRTFQSGDKVASRGRIATQRRWCCARSTPHS